MIGQFPVKGLYHFKLKSVAPIGKLSWETSNSGLTLTSQLLLFVIVSVS